MSPADAIISALRTGHDDLVAVVKELGDDDLARTSAASEWDVAQVLSHLGSGAEISRSGVRAALDGTARPGMEFNQGVWDRWKAMSRREQADEFLLASEELTSLYESLNAEARENLRIDLGFMPEPVDVASAARMRLNELALHSWDVRVTFDDSAALLPDATEQLLHDTTLLGWIAKAEHLDGRRATLRVETTGPDAVLTLNLADRVSVGFEPPSSPDGSLTLPAEAWLRLVAGRLAPAHTPDSVRATGAADLELLRWVFPGY